MLKFCGAKKTTILAVCGISAMLTACGSGGGGKTTTTTTTTTPTTTISAMEMADIGLLSLSLQDQLILMAMKEYPNLALAARTAARDAGSNLCYGGGSSSMLFADNDNSGTVTAGDTYTTTFNNCDDGYGSTYVSGSAQGTILATVGDEMPDFLNAFPPEDMTWGFQQAITFNNLQVLDQLENITSFVDGSATIVASSDAESGLYETSLNTNDMSVSGSYAGDSISIRYASGSSFGFIMDLASGKYGMDHDFRVNLSAGNENHYAEYLADPEFFGALDASSTGILDSPPTEGTWQVQWDSQAPVRLTAMSNGISILVETDADRNGSYETQETLLWSELLQEF